MLTRRDLLRAAALGAGSLALAACAPPGATEPAATPAGSAPTGTAAAATPSAPASTPTQPVAPPFSLRQKIGRLLIVGFRGLTLAENPSIQRAITEDGLGGVILFDRDEELGTRNVQSPEQVGKLVRGLRGLATDRELIVAIDQEGGLVTRLSPKWGFPAVDSEAAIGSKGDVAVEAWATAIATTLNNAAFNLNLAPVVDVNVNPTNPAIGALRRSFSADPSVVSRDAEVALEVYRSFGVRTALKHFPGLGSANANTDFGVADVTTTWHDDELDPYRHLLGLGLVDVVMAAHVVNGQIDSTAPASLSKATVTDLLRDTLGWQGLVVTDDLGAVAITEAFGFEDAIALAIEAGDDLLLFANQHDYDPELSTRVIEVIEDLVAAGRVTEARIDESLARRESLFFRYGVSRQ